MLSEKDRGKMICLILVHLQATRLLRQLSFYIESQESINPSAI